MPAAAPNALVQKEVLAGIKVAIPGGRAPVSRGCDFSRRAGLGLEASRGRPGNSPG
jgi:hypothetical protein